MGARARNSKISACDDGGGQGGTGVLNGGLRIVGVRDGDVVNVVEAREALFREFVVQSPVSLLGIPSTSIDGRWNRSGGAVYLYGEREVIRK